MSLDYWNTIEDTDVFVVWWCQSWMAVAQQCIKNDVKYILVDSNSKAWDSWKNRYDSLKLFTPAWLSSLPWLKMNIKSNRPTKDDMANYLADYESEIGIDVNYNTSVVNIEKDNGKFIISSKGVNTNDIIQHTANNIVIATWPFKDKIVPKFSNNLSSSVQQLHSSEYKSPSQIESDKVLIVWWWNSWYQIADELDKSWKEVFHSTRWSILKTPEINLKWLIAKLKFNMKDNFWDYPCSTESNDIPVPWQDIVFWKKYNNLKSIKDVIDCYSSWVIVSNWDKIQTDSVIRCTWFKNQYPWLNVEWVLDKQWDILHKNGITKIPWFYTIDCVGRIDSSARIARRRNYKIRKC